MNIRWKIAQFFEARWWRRYLKKKTAGSYLDWKLAYWKAFLENEKIEIKHGEKVMDAGCGPAGIFMAIDKNEVYAIDPLLGKYKSQLAHFQDKSLGNVHFETAKLEDWTKPFYFDKIFCLNAINHVADLELSLENICRSLKKNGTLYLSIDAHNFGFLKNIFRLIPGDILHPHQLSLQDYQTLLLKNGIETQNTSLIKTGFIFNYYLITGVKKIMIDG